MKIGTTKRGIGPAYEDKVGRRAIRLMDLAEPRVARRQDRRACSPITSRCGAASGLPPPTAAAIRDELMAVAPKVLPYMAPTFELLDADAARRQAHPVRGRAGRAARRRPRHLSVCDVVQHRRRQCGDRLGPRAARHRLCAWHRQGLYDARRRRAVPDRARRRGRPADRRARRTNSAPTPAGRAAAAGSTRCWRARRVKTSAASTASR